MVPQRIFQAVPGQVAHSPLARPLLILASLCAGLVAVGNVHAQTQTEGFQRVEAVVLDLRAGEASVRTPSRLAFASALAEHGEIHLSEDEELTAVLARAPYSPILAQGRASLSAAVVAFGGLDCPSTVERTGQAILDLAAAQARGVDASPELRQAYLYRFLCADRNRQFDEAMTAATMLRKFGEGRPKEISAPTWDKYPEIDAQSNLARVEVRVESAPPGARVWLDHEELGATPTTLLVAKGEHIVALGAAEQDRGGVSQRFTATGKGTLTLKIPKRAVEWKGVAQTLQDVRSASGSKRVDAMRAIMAALEVEVAFVMREPGRIAVWTLPVNRRNAEHYGNAPNASIAGRLALRALEESETRPGIDPNVPLLRESDFTETKSSSGRPWWIYGVVLGAAAIGAVFIVTSDLGEDQQRIEVTLP